jgi:hypothetical protein
VKPYEPFGIPLKTIESVLELWVAPLNVTDQLVPDVRPDSVNVTA